MEQEAVSAAEAMVASRDAAHDGSEMIVFLRNELDQDSGRVTRAASDSGDRFRWQSIHTIVGPDAGNSPSQDGSSGEDSSGSSDGSLQFVHYTQPLWTDEGSVDISDLLAFSLTELRSRIEAMDALLKAGEGVEGYKFCISQKLVSERHLRDHEAYYGKPLVRATVPRTIRSGWPSEILNKFESPGPGTGYTRHWLLGPDHELFQVIIVDDDDVGGNGYNVSFRAARPLPSGVYEIVQAYQFYIWIPCNFKYDDDQYNIWEVTVLPPEGTLHEAFFDPVESDGAIGASESIGVLEPRAVKPESTEGRPWGQPLKKPSGAPLNLG